MRLLLDSHVFLWAIQSPKELSETALAALQDTSNDLYVSLATLWELQIKSDLGKLTLSKLLSQMISEEVEAGRMSVLPIMPDHIYF